MEAAQQQGRGTRTRWCDQVKLGAPDRPGPQGDPGGFSAAGGPRERAWGDRPKQGSTCPDLIYSYRLLYVSIYNRDAANWGRSLAVPLSILMNSVSICVLLSELSPPDEKSRAPADCSLPCLPLIALPPATASWPV